MKRKFLFLSLMLGLWACEENLEGDRLDTSGPEIRILEPVQSDFHSGDTIPISIEFSDNDQLHDYYLGLNQRSAMRKLLHISRHDHRSSLRCDTFYVLPPEVGGQHYELQLRASDHAGNYTEKFKYLLIFQE